MPVLRNTERKTSKNETTMAEHRTKLGTFCATQSANGTPVKLATVEVFPATEWDESEQGLYRLRVNRSWVNGKGEYMDLAGVGRCLAGFVARMDDSDPDRPCTPPARREVHALDPCWADYGPKDKDGMQYESCQARVVSDDTVIGIDGRQYVVVSAPELGGVRLMAIDDLRFYDRQGERQ